jgi:hypothetical protein
VSEKMKSARTVFVAGSYWMECAVQSCLGVTVSLGLLRHRPLGSLRGEYPQSVLSNMTTLSVCMVVMCIALIPQFCTTTLHESNAPCVLDTNALHARIANSCPSTTLELPLAIATRLYLLLLQKLTIFSGHSLSIFPELDITINSFSHPAELSCCIAFECIRSYLC